MRSAVQAFRSWSELYDTIVGNRVIACNSDKTTFFLDTGILIESRFGGPAFLHQTMRDHGLDGFKVGHAFLGFSTIVTYGSAIKETRLKLESSDNSSGDEVTLTLLTVQAESDGTGFIPKDKFAEHLAWVSAKDLLRQAYRDNKAGEAEAT